MNNLFCFISYEILCHFAWYAGCVIFSRVVVSSCVRCKHETLSAQDTLQHERITNSACNSSIEFIPLVGWADGGGLRECSETL